MTLDADDVSYAPDNVAGGVAIGPGSPYKNALPAVRELVAYIQNLNIPSSQTADEIATALAADASAMATLQNAIEILADMFYAESNMNIPYTFEDVTDWVTAAAGNPATSLTTISASDIDDDATFGPEWEQDSQTSSVTVYQRTAFRPRRGRVYRVTVKGYVGGSNSCTLQAVVAQLNSSYVVTTANKAPSQNTTFTAANTEQTVTFTMSIDNVDADVDLDDVPFIRVGATLGPDTATSTNLRITEIHVEDVTEPFSNLDAATIVAAILASATSLESLKDGIVADFDANDIQAIVADLDADATSEQNLATALAGNATAMGTLGAGFSGDIDAGAFSANAVALADMAQLAEARVLGRADGAGIGDVTSLTGAQVATIADAATLTGTQTLTNKTLTAPVINVGSDADGDVYYRASGALARLAKGTAGQVLKMNSGATAPEWGAGASSYVSFDQTITAGGTLTLAHSLGAAPDLWAVFLECQTADLNYSTGEVILAAGFFYDGNAVSNVNYGCSVRGDATNLVVRFGSTSGVFSIPNASTGVMSTITSANWKAIFKAWVF